jgi:hypothetical protein
LIFKYLVVPIILYDYNSLIFYVLRYISRCV